MAWQDARRVAVAAGALIVAASPGTGAEFSDCPECPAMVEVAAGSFMMGSPKSEDGRYLDEDPQHPVTLARPFAIGKYEVTFAEWDACVADGGCSYRPDDEGWGRETRPVVNVSYADAQDYLRWLSARTGADYRLPSEAEWEYAARAGTTTRYWWGDEIGAGGANCRGCGGPYDEGTAPVGSFAANTLGLYDTHGNVREWVEDCWADRYAGAPADGSARVSGDCSVRVARGGSWEHGPGDVRAAFRDWIDSDYRATGSGFRVARHLDAGFAGGCPECPEMVEVAAGSFMLGSPEWEEGRSAEEGPQTLVTLAPFAIGSYEVTFAEWDACVAAGGCGKRPDDEGWGRGTRPVINISWDDAQEYVRWLRARTGDDYRLPSEAEWEYAARAGTTSRYAWGDEVGEENANCDGCGSLWDDERTAPVGSFFANPFGLYDVAGNASEWVEDCWSDSHLDAPANGGARLGGDCGLRVVRGGAWYYAPGYARSAARAAIDPALWFAFTGFRVARTLAPAAVALECSECPEMVEVAAGTFMFGSPEWEEGRSEDEGPQTPVTLAPFAIGKYEVTFAEWDACVAAGGCGRRPDDGGWGGGDRPVINVSWDDAQEYVRWLSARIGADYRLPSEAEWEYAARAGTTSRYAWGDEVGHDNANCDGCGSLWDDDQTAPVGSFWANALGLHDTHGNVAEWVEDCWSDSRLDAPADGGARLGGDCGLRVVRGGSWYYAPAYARSAARAAIDPALWFAFTGFRVARTAD